MVRIRISRNELPLKMKIQLNLNRPNAWCLIWTILRHKTIPNVHKAGTIKRITYMVRIRISRNELPLKMKIQLNLNRPNAWCLIWTILRHKTIPNVHKAGTIKRITYMVRIRISRNELPLKMKIRLNLNRPNAWCLIWTI